MSKTALAIAQMEAWAADDSHGYDQRYRWGEKGDYDCSAAIIQAWENAGVPVKSDGATYTGNMRSVFLRNGFTDVTSKINLSTGAGLIRGDVLLNQTHHTAMYCGDGYEVEASINEYGGAVGGQPGDQTGKEFLKRKYYNFPWTHILRYEDAESTVWEEPVAETVEEVSDDGETIPVYPVEVEQTASATITETTSHEASVEGLIDTVREVQIWLNRNYSAGLTLDGLYGDIVKKALIKALQTSLGVTVSLVFDAETKAAVKKKYLYQNSTGKLVEVLQAFLVCCGYKTAYVDGIFGIGTKSALMAYQKLHNLEVDGIAGEETFGSLCD